MTEPNMETLFAELWRQVPVAAAILLIVSWGLKDRREADKRAGDRQKAQDRLFAEVFEELGRTRQVNQQLLELLTHLNGDIAEVLRRKAGAKQGG